MKKIMKCEFCYRDIDISRDIPKDWNVIVSEVNPENGYLDERFLVLCPMHSEIVRERLFPRDKTHM